MATVRLLTDAKSFRPRRRRSLPNIRAERGSDFVNNFWRALAHDPVTL